MNNYNNYTEQINPEVVYLTIPVEWVCIYHKLLIVLSDIGKKIIDDCNTTCKGTGKTIINTWNIFQSALACKSIGETEKAEFLINYVIKQLDIIYKGIDKESYSDFAIVGISDDGKLEAIVSCDNDYPEFYVDDETKELFIEYNNEKELNKQFNIKNNNLILNKNETNIN